MPSSVNFRSHRRWCGLRVLAACAALAQLPELTAQAPVRYIVHATATKAQDGRIPLEVEIALPPSARAFTTFEIPVWTPGSYRLRDFPERITILAGAAGKAPDALRPAAVERLSRSTWLVAHAAGDLVQLRYRVDLKPDDRFMDPADTRRCLTYEGPAVYLRPLDHAAAPVVLQFDVPAGWAAGCGLAATGPLAFTAADYDELADNPVKLGVFQTFTFQAWNTRFDVYLDGGEDLTFDNHTWLAGLQRITEEAGAVFGGLPVDRYAFLFTASRNGGGGGLEHLSSTAIGLPRASFVRDPATSFGICAHEFFHVYNVKRLRPIELGPFRYDRPNRTTGLWLSEGVTSYYTPLLLARAGLGTAKGFWDSMARSIAALENDDARRSTSVEQASFRVWDKQAPDRDIDYYGAGTVLGLLLDLQIRAASHDQRSLDDALTAMWQTCRDQRRGLTSEEIEQHCSAAAGADLGAFFARCVRGTVVPDYATILAAAGMTCSVQERDRRPVLRGLDLGRTGPPTFRDFSWLESSGGGDPANTVGRLRQLDDQEVADAAQAEALVQAADKAGKRELRIEFELANGNRRTARAALESRVRWTVSLEADANAKPEAVARRESMTRARFVRK